MSRKTKRLSTESESSTTYAVKKSNAAAPPLASQTPPSKASVAARRSPKVRRLSSYIRVIAPEDRRASFSSLASIVRLSSRSIMAKMACRSGWEHCTSSWSTSSLKPSKSKAFEVLPLSSSISSTLLNWPRSATQIVQTRSSSSVTSGAVPVRISKRLLSARIGICVAGTDSMIGGRSSWCEIAPAPPSNVTNIAIVARNAIGP
mmetsp:Transcript_21585/g.64509  ORF Transcript_21585/g.64509 Transcript_21585/m.64509 type:complete len:204 (+) Transcript_21585:705-1316(+)